MTQHLTGAAHLEVDITAAFSIPFFGPARAVNEHRVRFAIPQFVTDTTR